VANDPPGAKLEGQSGETSKYPDMPHSSIQQTENTPIAREKEKQSVFPTSHKNVETNFTQKHCAPRYILNP
jgi:hypothetical protein